MVLKALDTAKAESVLMTAIADILLSKARVKSVGTLGIKSHLRISKHLIGLGSYPQVSGKLARQKAIEARNQLSQSIEQKAAKDQ